MHNVNMSKSAKCETYKHMDVLQKELNYFLVVAETLNITKASEVLGIQQSGLSRAIHRLEHDLGQKLFQRKNIGLALTIQGDRFYSAVKNTKQKWEENFNFLLNDSDSPTGLIKIGMHPSFGQNYLPNILKNICIQFPQIEIQISPLPSFQIIRKVLENEIDFGLVISEIKNPEIIQKNIGIDFLATFQTDSKKILTHFFINPETQISNRILKKYGHLRNIYIKDNELIAKAAAGTDLGVALLPFSVAQHYPELKQISGQLVKSQISLICHKEKLTSKANKKIYDEIQLVCRKQLSKSC